MESKEQNPTISTSGLRFVIIWSVALVVLFTVVGIVTVSRVNKYRVSAIARHNARIDPKAVEPGRTEVEYTLPAGANPRKVTAGIYLDSITAISILDSSWSPVFYIWFKWTGNDINPGETFRIMEGEIISKEKLIDKVVKGEHYALYLVNAKITKFFATERFPVDDHLLTIMIEDGKMMWKDLEYVPDTTNSKISSRVKMPGYAVSKTGMVMKPHTYKSNFGEPGVAVDTGHTYSQLIYGVWNVRPGLGTYMKIFVGLFAAVMIAMLAFFIKPADVDPRFGLGVGGFFGAVANTLIAASLVPDSGIMTLMDMVNGVGMLTIFLTVVQSTISLYLFDICGETALSRLYDRLSLVIFASGFLVINILIPVFGFVR